MPAYHFKQECKVYLVRGHSRWKVDVYPDLSFSQTFEELTRNVKTLHDQDAMFEEAAIVKANPANLELTVMLVKGNDFKVIGDWLTEKDLDNTLTTYDVYVETGIGIFKIEKCVAERGTIQITRDRIITASIQAVGTKLTYFGTKNVNIPGTLQPQDVTVSPLVARALLVELDTSIQPNLESLTIEIVNNVKWLDYETLHKSLYVTNASDTQYPEAFVVSSKVLSGTIRQYVTDENDSRVQTWSTNSSLRIRVGDVGTYYLDVNIPSVVYTNRLETGDVFLQTYDFRMTSSPGILSQVFNYKL